MLKDHNAVKLEPALVSSQAFYHWANVLSLITCIMSVVYFQMYSRLILSWELNLPENFKVGKQEYTVKVRSCLYFVSPPPPPPKKNACLLHLLHTLNTFHTSFITKTNTMSLHQTPQVFPWFVYDQQCNFHDYLMHGLQPPPPPPPLF